MRRGTDDCLILSYFSRLPVNAAKEKQQKVFVGEVICHRTAREVFFRFLIVSVLRIFMSYLQPG